MSTPSGSPGGKKNAPGSGARRILGILDREVSDRETPIAREAGGRPYFTDFHADFNISHSRDMAAVAFSGAGSPPPVFPPRPGQNGRPFRVGCDIQYMHPRKNRAAIAERFFSGAERDRIAAAGGNRLFYMIWTLKECWLKLRGLSVFDMGKAPVFCVGTAPGERGAGEPPPVDFYLYELEGEGESYMLAAARERGYGSPPSAPPVLRWFSETTLRVSSIDEIYAAPSPEKTAMPKS
ncbi:MAG: 4'-phosphopantetheinyl transferase superfamily protein [Treponema sp.]|nr:4'-phosphopantetheinyl transferase superfamily protein [Treponema sp.]